MKENLITISTVIHAPLEVAWTVWTQPEHITRWTFASDDWECPEASNDLRTGGSFQVRPRRARRHDPPLASLCLTSSFKHAGQVLVKVLYEVARSPTRMV